MALTLTPLLPGRPALAGLSPLAWVRTGASAAPTPAPRRAPATPVLRLDGVGIGDISLSFSAAAGEIVHLRGGSPVARLRVMAMAAGFAAGGSGSCEIMGRDTIALNDGERRALRERHVARVLSCDHLPAGMTAGASVAAPLLRQGLSANDAKARAAQELDALCAGSLAARNTDTLGRADSRLVLLARAMAVRPRLLVVEQPEDALNADALAAVRLALWSLASSFGACVLISSDHPRLIAGADRSVDLDRGTAAPSARGTGDASAGQRVPS